MRSFCFLVNLIGLRGADGGKSWRKDWRVEQQLEALREVVEFLDEHALRYVVIGGIANAVWGRPRATLDADLKVMIGDRTISEFVKLFRTRFGFRVDDPTAFAQQTYVLPLAASNGIGVDVGIGFFPYEEQAVEKAVSVQYGGLGFIVCSAEDLIIHKAISEREKDWGDIDGVVRRQGSKLDQKYILYWLEQFARLLERPQMVKRYNSLRRKIKKR